MKITNPIFLQSAGNAGGTFIPFVKMKSAANKLGVVSISCEGEISVNYQDNGVIKTDVYTDLEEVNLYIRADKGTYAIIKGNITYLDCSDNQLTALDVSGLNSLTSLDCYGNQFLNNEDAATTFAESLYTIEEGDNATLKINGTQVNAITEIAEGKGWTVEVV